MLHTLTLKAFFFNAKTDYLPYYKNFIITVNDTDTAEDLLASIHTQNSDFNYPKHNLIMQINGLIVEASASIASLVQAFGTTMSINPANSYRANHGLEINDDDFMHSFKLLEAYATEEDLVYYQSLYALHYASETEKYSHDYIGDAILVLAHKMISDGNENKEEILNILTSVDCGLLSCEYEHNLFNSKDYSNEIKALKDMLDEEDEHLSLLGLIKHRFCKEKSPKSIETTRRIRKTVKSVEDKNIAYHSGLDNSKRNIISQIIIDINSQNISIPSQEKLLGFSILKTDKTLALKKAGIRLLEAFDASTEILIIEDEASYDMCEKHFKSIEKIIGREMIGLELIFVEDFIAQASLVEE